MTALFTPLSLIQLIDQFQPIAMRPYAGANLDDHTLQQQLILLQRLISKLINCDSIITEQPWLTLLAKTESHDEHFYQQCYQRALCTEMPCFATALAHCKSQQFARMRPRADYSFHCELFIERVQHWLFRDDCNLPHNHIESIPEITNHIAENIKTESSNFRDRCKARHPDILNSIRQHIEDIQLTHRWSLNPPMP